MSIKQKIKSLRWKPWLERNFSPFVASFFTDGGRKEYFENIGVKGVDCKAMLYQKGCWLESEEVWEDMAKKAGIYLKNHSIFDVTKSLERFYKEKKKRIIELTKQKQGDPIKQLAEVYEIMTLCTTYIWLAHGVEYHYTAKLKKEVPNYIKNDIDEFIGDASFPLKKNMHSLMEKEIREGKDPKKIAKRFGWMRARDIDSEPFSEQDIKDMKKELKPAETHQKARIPKELEGLFKEVQELVFFRTARTDVYYEFMLLSRPIFKRVAGFYKIPYTGLKFYPVPSLIKGKPKKYSMDYTFACYEGSCSFFDKPLVIESETKEADSISGMVAYKGIVRGTARILRDVSELSKVKSGDILVTQMTFPAFLPAMARAAAFVTDEGGITCHAAIVAREMRKPCIIGTKIATKVFKDGDLIEVDANKGIARKV